METESTLGAFGAQSSLSPAGLSAEAIYGLTYAMTFAFGAVFVVMLAVIWLAWRRDTGGRGWWIWGGGIVLPLVAILTLLVFSTSILQAITREDPDALLIEVTGHQFWWDVVYDPDGAALRDANEVVIPAGRPVTFRLRSNDVIHSFWIPSIAGKMDMIPGRVNTLTVTATEPGRFRGQCAEFCGLAHPLMAFEVVVLEAEAFDEWLANLDGEARDPVRPQEVAGREVFLGAGCAACHRIAGVAEGGVLGPDLSRVGARASLGAGMWDMNTGNLAGWIADVQDMKPGAQMPPYNDLSGPELRAVTAYLESLQ
ncbi:cytochrome c oxidase subunit II [Jannaschia sp. EhC01]|nr:cytochrome c oxidase subunit II [Jannaschia sp. EhC01]